MRAALALCCVGRLNNFGLLRFRRVIVTTPMACTYGTLNVPKTFLIHHDILRVILRPNTFRVILRPSRCSVLRVIFTPNGQFARPVILRPNPHGIQIRRYALYYAVFILRPNRYGIQIDATASHITSLICCTSQYDVT